MECALQDLRQPRLPFGHPARVVLAHGLLVVAEQVGNIRDRHTSLKENACEGVPQSMRRRRFIEGFRGLETFASRLRHTLVTVSSRSECATMKRPLAIPFRSRPQAIAQPIGDIGKHLFAVLLRSKEDLVAVHTLDVEERRV